MYDKDEAIRLIKEGLSDSEVAEEVGCGRNTSWRLRKSLEQNPSGTDKKINLEQSDSLEQNKMEQTELEQNGTEKREKNGTKPKTEKIIYEDDKIAVKNGWLTFEERVKTVNGKKMIVLDKFGKELIHPFPADYPRPHKQLENGKTVYYKTEEIPRIPIIKTFGWKLTPNQVIDIQETGKLMQGNYNALGYDSIGNRIE